MSFPEVLNERMAQAESAGSLRELKSRRGLDFSSNDYLGFSSDPELKRRVIERLARAPLGATGSRLLRGQIDLFEETESELAQFCGREASLLYPSGYQANVGLLSALLRPGDVIFSDEKNHASIIDGIRLGRGDVRIYPHGDVEALRKMLEGVRDVDGLRFIVTESLFSMDGDQSPLLELADLAEEFSAHLIVDESHATGLWRSGLVESLELGSRVFATLHTGGKALGCGGAWIACEASLKRYLVNFSRSFIFSTAPIPFLAAALSEAVRYWKEVGVGRAKLLHSKSERFRNLLLAQKMTSNGLGPIFPVILGNNERTVAASHFLSLQGFDVRAIRPPTVPQGAARLRITIGSQHETADLERLAQALGEI
jgi:8-amino-7-oxononanoate synthase